MGPEWVAILALVALFVVGTVLPINMGALAYVAAWLVGMWSLDMDEKDIVAGVSSDLVLTLIGVTYLFAIAKKNGTVDLIVRVAVKGVRGRVALIPWVMFAITAVAVLGLVIFAVAAVPLFDLDNLTDIAPTDAAGASAFLPYGVLGIWAAVPYAIWFFLAVESVRSARTSWPLLGMKSKPSPS